MIPYLFHVSILLAGGYVFYWFLLRQETFFRLNRVVLLACLLLPLVLPLITIPASWSLQLLPIDKITSIVSPSLTDTPLEAKEIVPVPKREATNEKETLTTPIANNRERLIETKAPSSIEKVLAYLYFTGVLVFALAFIIQLVLIIAKRKTLNIIKDGKYQIVELVKEEAPFSFWRSIFINPANYDPDTYEQIVAHEKIHIDQAHFMDKLLAEFLLIVFWFNPFIWLFRKVISNNLEFLTDQSMLTKGFPKQTYQMSLFKVSVPQFPLNLTTNYNQSFLKNRIAMMNTKKSSARSIWKYLFMLPLLGFSMMSLNTVEQNETVPPPTLVEQSAVKPNEENKQIETPATADAPPTQLTQATAKPKKSKKKETTKRAIALLNYGLWKATLKGNQVCFFLNNVSNTKEETRSICYQKEEIDGFAERKDQSFKIKQEQGTLLLEGDFSDGKGRGVFTFNPNPSFVKFLKNEEMIEIEEEKLILLFVHKLDKTYFRNVIEETVHKNIKRHSISINEDYHIFAIVNNGNQQRVKVDNHIDINNSNHKNRTNNNPRSTYPSNRYSDGSVHIETINGKTYVQGKGIHNINGTILNISGNETWVVEQDGSTYKLKDVVNPKESIRPKIKTQLNRSDKLGPSASDGIEKHYLKQSRGKGHLDWIGYSETILEPSTQALYQLPAFCQEFHRELVKDEIIDNGDKILFYFGREGAYVNGWHLSGGHYTKYLDLAKKYDIRVSKGWNIELDGQNVLLINAVRDVEQLRIDLRKALANDGLVTNGKEKILMKISGNRFIVNGEPIPEGKLTSYFRLLRTHRITPAPGKIIQMGRKKNKNYIHVGYGEDNSFLGTFSTD